MDFYLFLEIKKRRKHESVWFNFNLMVKGRTLQIWAPINWKIRIPFSGQGGRLIHKDIMKEDPVHRNPIVILAIDYNVITSEDEDQVYEDNDEEDKMIDDDILDTQRDF